MLDAPIVRLILAYHLTCSRWKCSWGEGTHWKASGTYVKSKKHTSPNWIVMGNLVPGQSRIGPLMQRNIHWWHVPSSSSTQASQSASTCPTSWLGRPGLQPGPEMPMAAMALKPGSYIYIYWTISWNGKTRHARLPCLVFLLEQNTKMDTRTHQRCGFSCTCLGLPRDRASTLTLLPDWGMENTSTTRTSESRCNL